MSRYAIGIDLGTTFSCVGVFEKGKVEIITNDQGNRTTPSYVAFTKQERLIGEAAKNQAGINPENTVFNSKRLIGRRFDDPCVQSDMKNWPFTVLNKDKQPKIQVNYLDKKEEFFPEQISAMVLEKMKKFAEEYIGKGEKITDAAITVPAYFNDAQRKATYDAGKIAGLNVLRILSEPTSAAIAYGMYKEQGGGKLNVLVYDLGGGTFDVSVLTIKQSQFEVKATSGNTHLGGEDFDTLMVEYFTEEFKRKYKTDPSSSKKSIRRLRAACERAKRTLSSASETAIDLDSFYEGIDFYEKITRAKFEGLCLELFESTIESVAQALKDAQLTKGQIDEVILVGGSTRIPKVQSILQEIFNGKELNKSINQDEAVAYGAAIVAAKLSGCELSIVQDLVLKEVTPLSLGLETRGGNVEKIIRRNTPIPVKITRFCCPDESDLTKSLLNVFEGEREMAVDNNFLGNFVLNDIYQPEEGKPSFEVTFEIDVNGILCVTAVDKIKNQPKSLTISRDKSRHSKLQINRMLKETEKFHDYDEKQRILVDRRNALENYVYLLKSKFKSKKSQLSESNRTLISEEIVRIDNWIKTNLHRAPKGSLENRLSQLKEVCRPILGNL